MDYRELFFAGDLHRERSAAVVHQILVSSFDGVLDVLRIMLNAANDNQIFQTAGDEEFILVLEAQITGAQIWTVTVGEKGTKDSFRFALIVPVALRDSPA